MAQKLLHWIVIALFVLTLAVNLSVWGGLAEHPELGAGIVRSADREGPLARVYIFGGMGLSSMGLREFNRDFADRRFGSLYPRLKGNTEAAMDIIDHERSSTMALSHYGTPVLLLLAIALSWMRPKPIHMVGGR
ncbi:MAG TPA: hypothetical protein VFG21_09785 [Xanthomonadaceae bacterium]|nr:hypothetical protein [Xanthomonadaceae bacterium]